MPRFAYALPLADERADQWRRAAERLLGDGAKDHRTFLLERGIFRERMWVQQGTGTPTMSLVLWDCDDVDVATRIRSTRRSDHDQWLLHTVFGEYHGQDPETFAFPEPQVLSGTTTMATAAAGTQTMFALPIAEQGLPAVRQLIDRIEQGDLAAAHRAFLADASIREEWIWLQDVRADTPALLLFHWIGDDLPAAWDRLTHVGEGPYARVLRDALFTPVVGLAPGVVAGWDIDQVLAMHVRRTDATEPSVTRLAGRISAALSRRRWQALRQVCTPTVKVMDPDHRVVSPQEAMDVLADAIDDLPGVVDDVLVSDRQVLCVLAPQEPEMSGGGTRLRERPVGTSVPGVGRSPTMNSGMASAVLFGIRDSSISSVRLVRDWPPS